MNNKLLLQDLTDQLAEAGKLKKKDAEELLRAFFKIAEDGLFEDGIIKINGLGTLKLVLVDARKSVNVSTGEEFEIREHYKVSFVPDADLKNAVNQPYSHLEPVELDPVVESNVSTAPEKKVVNTKEKVPTVEIKEEMVSPKAPRKIKRTTIAWALFFLLIAVFGVWSWVSNLNHNREEAAKSKEIALIDSLEADANLQADLAALKEENDSVTSSANAADDSLEAVIQSVAKEPSASEPAVAKVAPAMKAKQTPSATKALVAVTKTTTPATKPVEAKPTPQPAVKTATTPAKTPVSAAVKTTTVPTKTPVSSVKTATTPAKTPVSTVKPTPEKAPVEYIATVVLKPGDRLNLLSLKYYGDKIFWVYIYQANKSAIPNPDNVPAGTTIRIPKPDPKLIDPKNEALVAKAKALQLKYIGAQ